MAATKILILDVDVPHNEKIAFALREDKSIQVEFYKTSEELLDVLNNKAGQQENERALQKDIESGVAMQAKVTDTVDKSYTLLVDKKAQLKIFLEKPDQKLNATIVEQDIKTLEAQLAKCTELLSKLEKFMEQKKQAFEKIKTGAPKSEDFKVNLVLVDRSFLGNIPSKWVQAFRAQITLEENKLVPLAVLGYNEAIEYIQSTLTDGVIDYFVKPVDLLLFKHNTAKLSGKVVDASVKVYEIKTETDIKMLRTVSVQTISEFELVAQTNFSFALNEVCEFYAEQFSADKSGRILGRCLETAPDSTKKGSFISKFSLVGLSPTRLNEMRKWLRAQYLIIKAKEKDQ